MIEWTNRLPTKEGYYWRRFDKEKPEIVYVSRFLNGKLYMYQIARHDFLDCSSVAENKLWKYSIEPIKEP